MKKIMFCATLALALITGFSACQGSSDKNSEDSTATGQEHVGNSGPTDTGKLTTTPVETGGKDTSGNGAGSTNAPKDTLKTNP